HPLDGLAVEDEDLVIVQGRRQRGQGRGVPGVDVAKPCGASGQEGGADGDGGAAQLAVGDAGGGAQVAAVSGGIEALLAAAVVFEEGVADEADDRGEDEDLGVTPAAVLVEDLIDRVGVGGPSPQGQDGLSQGQPGQSLGCRELQDGPPGEKDLLIS